MIKLIAVLLLCLPASVNAAQPIPDTDVQALYSALAAVPKPLDHINTLLKMESTPILYASGGAGLRVRYIRMTGSFAMRECHYLPWSSGLKTALQNLAAHTGLTWQYGTTGVAFATSVTGVMSDAEKDWCAQ